MIEVYRTDCPKCRVLKKRLEASGVSFDLIEDEEKVLEKAKEFGLQEVPFIIADGELYRFTEAIKNLEVFKCK